MIGSLVKYQQGLQGKFWDQSHSNFQVKDKNKNLDSNSIILAWIINFFATTSKSSCPSSSSFSFSCYWITHAISTIHHLVSKSLFLRLMLLKFFQVSMDYFPVEWELGTVWQEIFKYHIPSLNCCVSVLFLRQPIALHPSEVRMYHLVFLSGYKPHRERNTNVFKFLYKIANNIRDTLI